MLTRDQIIDAYKQACAIDINAFKPGNVSVYSEGHDMGIQDFILSSDVSSLPISNTDYSLGEKIFYAVEATRNAVHCNTNLGILLLCAALIEAEQNRTINQPLQDALQTVLDNTTIEDAEWVFKAITLAAPGGLGESKEQDVTTDAAQVTLVQAMNIAKDKDKIAEQYTTAYKDIFNFSISMYNTALLRFEDQEWATVVVFTSLLRKFPDSHIERKYGNKYSEWVRKQIITVDDALSNTDKPELLIPMLHDVDRAFKDKGINPGTTADLTVATVFVVLMESFSV